MKPFTIVLSATSIISLALLFWAYNNDYLVIAFRSNPHKSQFHKTISQACCTKKQVVLSYWRNDRWYNEKTDLLWTNSAASNCYQLIARWLILLDEEKIIDRRISLQNALIGPTGQEVYISFDRNILTKDTATFMKLMLIEALLKTLRENDIPITKVWFLVHHQPMHDQHLDFSHAWPINGFSSL